jgi:uncharacterized delta-60 repeat protein
MIERLSSRIHFAVFGPDLNYDDGFPDVTDTAFLRQRVSGGKTLAAFRVQIPLIGIPDEQREFTTRFSRYLADGTLDRTFGKNGQLNVGITSQVKVVAGSRILVVPEYYDRTQVVRSFTLNGRADATFGGDGEVTIPVNARIGGNVIRGDSKIVDVLADGRVLLQTEINTVVRSGSGPSDIQHQHDIVRLHRNGSLDTAFARKGFLSFRQDRGYVRPFVTDRALYVHADYGFSTDPASGEIVKLSLDGKTPDLGFGGDGRVAIPGFVEAITEQPDGKLLFIDATFGKDPVLYRINTDGSPDTSFSGDGKITLPDPGIKPDTYNAAITLDAQNRILISAQDTLFRFSPTGTLDAYPFNGTAPLPSPVRSVDAQGNVFAADGMKYGLVLPQQLDANGIVRIVTDSRDDVIDISAGSGRVRVVVNGESVRFRLGDVRGFDIKTFDGDLDLKVTVDRPVTLAAGNGDAVVRTAGGDDRITMGWGDHDVASGAGNDRIELGEIVDNRPGDRQAIVGSGGNKNILIRNGSAVIDLAAGNHEVVTVSETHDNKITIAGGNNEIRLRGKNETLTIGGRGANDVTSFGENARVTTGTGPDKVLAISPFGTFNTAGGDDEVTIRTFGEKPTRGVTVFAGSGDDHVFCDPGYQSLATAYGGPGDDLLEGHTLSQRLYGENGNDTLNGGDGIDTLYGGDRDDLVIGGASSDRLYGDAGNDRLYGQSGNDKLFGGPGDDRLFAQTGNDELSGEAGNDRLYADNALGRYLMRGGPGDDLFFTRNNGIDTLFGDDGDDRAEADENDVLNDVIRA